MQKKYEPMGGPDPFRDWLWLLEVLAIGETKILP